jgi:hypothetical protein
MPHAPLPPATTAPRVARRRIGPPLAAAALAFAGLGATCGPRSTPPAPEPTAAAPGERPPAGSGRFIVTLRRPPGDTARPTRADLEARLSTAALQRSGGRVVDAVPLLHALVVDGVRDPEPLRREPNVASVIPDVEGVHHPAPPRP